MGGPGKPRRVNRRSFEHVARAAAAITGETELVAVGSQAALVQHARLPARMLLSPELDLYPRRAPELAELIEGSIGEGSPFHGTFGYYAQGVGPETAKLPAGWEERAFRLKNQRTGGATVIAPELHDLRASKLVAGREKDFDYVEAALASGLLAPDLLDQRLTETVGVDQRMVEQARRWLARRGAAGTRP
jgi:hypothetical protein